MKKEYIKPEMEETLVLVESPMLDGSPLGIKDGNADDSDALSRGRRGTWGNLWDED